MQLYKIASEYAQALEALEQMEDVTPEMIEDSLANMKDNLEEKVLNVAAYVKKIEQDLSSIKSYIASAEDRYEKLDKKRDNLISYLRNIYYKDECEDIPQ